MVAARKASQEAPGRVATILAAHADRNGVVQSGHLAYWHVARRRAGRLALACQRTARYHVSECSGATQGVPRAPLRSSALGHADKPGTCWLRRGCVSASQARIAFDLGLIVMYGAITLLALRHLPVAFSLHMIGLLALCVMSPIALAQDVYISAGRYLLAAAPLFLLLGQWSRRPWLDTLPRERGLPRARGSGSAVPVGLLDHLRRSLAVVESWQGA